MRRILTNILYLLALLSAILIFAIDGVLFKTGIGSQTVVALLGNLREILVLVLIVTWTVIVKRRLIFDHLKLPEKLWRLVFLVLVNFVVAFILELSLDPQYVPEDLTYLNLAALIQSNVIGKTIIFTLVPVLFIMRELIFYKQKRTTKLYFNIFLVLITLTALYSIYTQEVISPDVDSSKPMNAVIVISLGLIILLLSLRNDWITYLPRREKFVYFGLGVIVFIFINSLRNFVYSYYLDAYSVVGASFGYAIYYFLLIYSLVAVITLLVHLPASRAVDRKLREVNSLHDFAREINSELNHQKITQLITKLTTDVLESKSTWLEEYNPASKRLRVVSQVNLTQKQILQNPFDEISGFNKDVVDERRPVLVNDISQHPELSFVQNWKKDARALIAAPLLSSRDQLIGILYATKAQPYGFDIDDVSLIEGVANQSVIALENADLWITSLEKGRLEHELQVARNVQLKLLPQVEPEIEGVELSSYFLTAYEVGGDYYDYIEFTDNMPGIVIGDVSGKGTSAAFYMAEFKGVIQTLAQTENDPKELVCRANKVFYATIERQSFITAIVGKIYPKKRQFTFVRAGHTPILYVSPGKGISTYLQPDGLGIGLDKGRIFDRVIALETIKALPGDVLVLFTDGVIELRNQENEEFGEERLEEIVKNAQMLPAEEIKTRILDEVMTFVGETPLHDDLTMIVMRFT